MADRGILLAAALLLLAGGPAADTVLLRNGERLEGRIVAESADSLHMDVRVRRGRTEDAFERRVLARAAIAAIRYEDLGDVEGDRAVPRDPDYNSIMFCPTPATLPKGDFYFRDFEVLIINFGWGARDGTSLSFMTHFPVVSVLDFGSIGFKQRLLDREKHAVGLALAGSYTFFDGEFDSDSFLTANLIAGWGNRERSVNLSLNQTYVEGEDPLTTVVAGADSRTSRRSKAFVEYMNATTFLEEGDFDGFINLGIRFFGDDWSFSLAGMRPLENTGDLVLIPMIQFSYHAQ